MSKPLCPQCGVRNKQEAVRCYKCGAAMMTKRPMDKRLKYTLLAILLLYAGYYGVRVAMWAFKLGH